MVLLLLVPSRKHIKAHGLNVLYSVLFIIHVLFLIELQGGRPSSRCCDLSKWLTLLCYINNRLIISNYLQLRVEPTPATEQQSDNALITILFELLKGKPLLPGGAVVLTHYSHSINTANHWLLYFTITDVQFKLRNRNSQHQSQRSVDKIYRTLFTKTESCKNTGLVTISTSTERSAVIISILFNKVCIYSL